MIDGVFRRGKFDIKFLDGGIFIYLSHISSINQIDLVIFGGIQGAE